MPVETIELRAPELEGLDAGEFEIIGQKVTHRLAQRPGSYVILKYVRPVVKRRAMQTIHCPPAPAGVIEGSRADVSFLAGLLVDKFAWHLPLYRQHQRLEDAGIRVSRPWLTQLVQQVTGLLDNLIVEGQLQFELPENAEPLYADVRSSLYRRSFSLSGELETGKIEASLKDGVFTARIPKRAERRPRKLEVQGS